jgi:hypothetical protein
VSAYEEYLRALRVAVDAPAERARRVAELDERLTRELDDAQRGDRELRTRWSEGERRLRDLETRLGRVLIAAGLPRPAAVASELTLERLEAEIALLARELEPAESAVQWLGRARAQHAAERAAIEGGTAGV